MNNKLLLKEKVAHASGDVASDFYDWLAQSGEFEVLISNSLGNISQKVIFT